MRSWPFGDKVTFPGASARRGSKLRRIRLISALGLFAWLATFVRHVPANGDAALWLTQILQGDFSTRTIHLGYLLSAWPFLRMDLFPPAYVLNVLSLVWILAALWAMLRIEQDIAPGPFAGLGALLWILLPPMTEMATTAEIYPLQLASQLFALSAWLRGMSLRAGIAFGFSLAVSPTSIAMLPLFFGFEQEASRLRSWKVLLVSGGLLWGVVLFYSGWDYWIGPRGLLNVPAGLGVGDALYRRLDQVPETFGWLLIPYGIGVLFSFFRASESKGTRRMFMALGGHLLVTALFFDRYSDVPAYALALAWGSIVVSSALRREGLESKKHIGSPAFEFKLSAKEMGAGLESKKHIGSPAFEFKLSAKEMGEGLEREKRVGKERTIWGMLMLLLFLQGFLTDQSLRYIRRKEVKLADKCLSLSTLFDGSMRISGTFRERRICGWVIDGDAFSERILSMEEIVRGNERRVGFVSLEGIEGLPPGVFQRVSGAVWVWKREKE